MKDWPWLRKVLENAVKSQHVDIVRFLLSVRNAAIKQPTCELVHEMLDLYLRLKPSFGTAKTLAQLDDRYRRTLAVAELLLARIKSARPRCRPVDKEVYRAWQDRVARYYEKSRAALV